MKNGTKNFGNMYLKIPHKYLIKKFCRNIPYALCCIFKITKIQCKYSIRRQLMNHGIIKFGNVYLIIRSKYLK